MKVNSMGDMSAIEAAIQALDSPDWSVRIRAKSDLVAMGSAAVEVLIAAMTIQAGRVCWEAADVLSQIDDSRRIAPMIKALTSANPLLGQTAVAALENVGEEMVEPFINALPHSHHFVQIHLVCALEKLRDQRAVLPLMKLLETTESSELRLVTIQALGIIGDPQASELIRAFQDNEDHHVRKRAQIALWRLQAAAGSGSQSSE